ncbi:MAG: hypothetical protein V1859_04895 [archaeon]
MRKNITQLLFVSVVLVTLLVTSCTNDNSGETGKKDLDFKKGTTGLTMSFLPELPPVSLYNTYPLTVIVEYRNTGASDINNGVIYLTGFDERYIPFDVTSQTISGLEGKSASNPDGVYREMAEFRATQVNIENLENIDSFQQIIRATACYLYASSAYPVVCIDPSYGRGVVTKKICEIKPITLSGGQGAPVAITKIDEEMGGSRSGGANVIFRIYIKNMGKGTTFASSRGVTNCHSELTYYDVDTVTVDSVSFSDIELTCKPDVIRLEKGEGSTICSAQGSFGNGQDAYTTPLNIELSYGYRDSIETTVKIINLD